MARSWGFLTHQMEHFAAAITLAAGVIFFLVAIRQLLEQYEPSREQEAASAPKSPFAAAVQMIFPVVLTH